MIVESMRSAFHLFLKAMKACYGEQYLNRVPTENELQAIETKYAEHRFPGCIGTLDCMQVPCKTAQNLGKVTLGILSQVRLQLSRSKPFVIVICTVGTYLVDDRAQISA